MRFFVGHFKGNTKEERQKKILEISLSLSLSLSLSWKNKHASNNERRKDDHTRIRVVFFPFKKLSSCGYVRKGVWILKRPPLRFRERERESQRSNISRLFLFFLLLESALFVSLSEGVRGKRRCARALGSSSTSRRRAMMTKSLWLGD